MLKDSSRTLRSKGLSRRPLLKAVSDGCVRSWDNQQCACNSERSPSMQLEKFGPWSRP